MIKYICRLSLLILVVASIALPVQAKVSQQEADRLKKDLTPFGAERAGNAEGTIPAWTGGMMKVPENVQIPAGFDPKNGDVLPDPFADEKPLYSITAQNVSQYADKLSPGVQKMFQRFPDTYRIDVYPTHRTHGAPQWVYDNTYRNALEGELNPEKFGVWNAQGGIPFPIPDQRDRLQGGAQAIWNGVLGWTGPSAMFANSDGVVYPGGKFVHAGQPWMADARSEMWYKPGSTYEDAIVAGFWNRRGGDFKEPARRKGEIIAAWTNCDFPRGDRKVWVYNPGQRRIRLSPNVSYDTPQPSYAGMATYDDTYNYNGQIDRFDWKLVGKKEMIIPYNGYKFTHGPIVDGVFLDGHINPDYMRWELHRVWIVDATVKPGSRHVYGRRVFYLDEDTWHYIVVDKYDNRGNLWRLGIRINIWEYYNPLHPEPYTRIGGMGFYDFTSPLYGASQSEGLPREVGIHVDPDYISPQAIRRRGRR